MVPTGFGDNAFRENGFSARPSDADLQQNLGHRQTPVYEGLTVNGLGLVLG